MRELVLVSKRCRDSNKVIMDSSFRYWQLHMLTGCYGRVIEMSTLY